jgi:beta-lactamase class D
MWHYIQAAEFGNVNIDGGIDRFWLDGELRISATEQVLFLRRLHGNDLPFSQRSIEIAKDIMLVEENDEYALRAKSGWGAPDSGQIGWWIGYVERGDDTYFFSANVDILRDEDASARTSVPRAILRELGIL